MPTNEIESKRIGLLREGVPGVSLIRVLLNPSADSATGQLQEIEDAARTVSQKLVVANASNDEELNAAFESLIQQRVNALLVSANSYFDVRRNQIIAFAAQNRLPQFISFANMRLLEGL